jgi:hypothetical protein
MEIPMWYVGSALLGAFVVLHFARQFSSALDAKLFYWRLLGQVTVLHTLESLWRRIAGTNGPVAGNDASITPQWLNKMGGLPKGVTVTSVEVSNVGGGMVASMKRVLLTTTTLPGVDAPTSVIVKMCPNSVGARFAGLLMGNPVCW